MTATEVLRRLLDERRVVWGASDTYRLLVTSWSDASGHSWSFMEHRDGSFNKLTAYHLTPKQAIAATLGTGTCHIVKTWSDSDYVDGWRYCCSECGCFIPVNERDPETGDVISAANYCPNCGRRCVG